jgi:hypothetical protein
MYSHSLHVRAPMCPLPAVGVPVAVPMCDIFLMSCSLCICICGCFCPGGVQLEDHQCGSRHGLCTGGCCHPGVGFWLLPGVLDGWARNPVGPPASRHVQVDRVLHLRVWVAEVLSLRCCHADLMLSRADVPAFSALCLCLL